LIDMATEPTTSLIARAQLLTLLEESRDPDARPRHLGIKIAIGLVLLFVALVARFG
jgi:hypothetical protein